MPGRLRTSPRWALIGVCACSIGVAARATTLDGQSAARFGGERQILSADHCTTATLGDGIPASAIGEPVSGVVLTPPRWIAASDALPARCEIDGQMAPNDSAPIARPINFRVWLPAEWNRRAVQQGGGGMNGIIPDLQGAQYSIDGRSLAQWGFVTFGSDSGHEAPFGRRGGPPAAGGSPGQSRGDGGSSNGWAVNEEAIRNLGYLQLKKTRDAAMVIVQRAYGERPRFTYFTGTSQGGREALTAAQRYPADYDGVIANVPIVSFSTLMLAPELIRIREKPLANWVTPAKTNAIRAEFLRQCDHLDGLTDGVIGNYMACRAIFEVALSPDQRRPWTAKRCPNDIDPAPSDSSASACLTDAQIATLELVYSRYRFATPLAHDVRTFGMWVPNTDPSGSGLIASARFKGQEGAASDAAVHSHLGVLGVTGFLMRDISANPLDYEEGGRFNRRREELSALLDATDPDLRAFARRGGKMIVTIGTDDTLASPGAQLDYYESILREMGRRAVDGFARLFVIPQANHGLAARTADVDGSGKPIERVTLPTSYERFALLVDWVERGTAPGKSIILTGGGPTALLCSYPQYPRYITGPSDAARSYRCGDP
jgi:hypothetical protein